MKKKGFTLAEVLVTLGIIGVVAALAMPALNSAVQRTKVGPSLRKFMNAVENADRMAMQEGDVDDLSETATTTPATYYSVLTKQFAGASTTDVKIKDSAGKEASAATKVVRMNSGEEFYATLFKKDNKEETTGSGNYKGRLFKLTYDMDGFTNGANKNGKDRFYFYVDRNGSVIPLGSNAANSAYSETVKTSNNASTACDTEDCSGAIANNNWKVGYKY